MAPDDVGDLKRVTSFAPRNNVDHTAIDLETLSVSDDPFGGEKPFHNEITESV